MLGYKKISSYDDLCVSIKQVAMDVNIPHRSGFDNIQIAYNPYKNKMFFLLGMWVCQHLSAYI